MAAKSEKILEIEDKYPDEEFLYMAGYDEALMGVVERINMSPVLCYDRDIVIQILERDMDETDALEYFEFNIAGAYVGEKTPMFLSRV